MRLTAEQCRNIYRRFDSGMSIKEVSYSYWNEEERYFIGTLNNATSIVEQVLRSHIRKLEAQLKKVKK